MTERRCNVVLILLEPELLNIVCNAPQVIYSLAILKKLKLKCKKNPYEITL